MDTPYQPNGTGFDALYELGQVDWSRLEHCYGKASYKKVFPGLARAVRVITGGADEGSPVG